ncbi:MAG TPA: hypothetical protein VGQ11_04210 [Candidatus Acidoferrales bacterium]|nr:hypothetical protein [Candidatus Acidoferrales bacterium]
MASSRIFLGDLARALMAVGSARGENWEQIAGLLGFTRGVEALQDTSSPAPPAITEPRSSAAATPKPVELPPSQPVSADIGEVVEFELDRQTAARSPIPQSIAPPSERRRAAALFLQPLLDPLWERGILIEAVGRQLAEGEIDVLAVVEAIAWGKPLAEAPREMVQSVSKGCQVLIDNGAGMRPFARDSYELLSALRRAVGAEHTRVLTFVDCPTRGVLNETYDDEPYKPPDNGAPVLAVSDLCSGGPGSAIRRAAPRDWLRVARMVRDAGSMLVVLNPYPRKFWPTIVSARVPISYWDRETRAADVRRARRRNR